MKKSLATFTIALAAVGAVFSSVDAHAGYYENGLVCGARTGQLVLPSKSNGGTHFADYYKFLDGYTVPHACYARMRALRSGVANVFNTDQRTKNRIEKALLSQDEIEDLKDQLNALTNMDASTKEAIASEVDDTRGFCLWQFYEVLGNIGSARDFTITDEFFKRGSYKELIDACANLADQARAYVAAAVAADAAAKK